MAGDSGSGDTVALNLFPLARHDFSISLFRVPFEGDRPEHEGEAAVRRFLTIGGEDRPFWTFLRPVEGAERVELRPFDDRYATLDVLRDALHRACVSSLGKGGFELVGRIHRRAEITLARHPEGSEVMSLEPYLLLTQGLFGFLANFRFRPLPEYAHSPRALELSLALDHHGQRNLNHYADRYDKLRDFVARFHGRLFPLQLANGERIPVRDTLAELETQSLDVKRYVVGSSKESKSQFMGVKDHGPFAAAGPRVRICFLYRAEDRPLSQDLFRALRGDSFRTFSGMEKMFGMELANENVTGIALRGFDRASIETARDEVVRLGDESPVVPIVLTPFSRHDDPEKNSAYWQLKHAFLSQNIPIQVVAADTVRDTNKLKWSTSGIGLQVFAKAGGTPWKVRPRHARCLIIGVGQAHRIHDGIVERYYAYSVLTDSSGVFEEVRVLGEGQDESTYLEHLGRNVEAIISDYDDRFSSFVVHATFSIRHSELERIAEVLRSAKASHEAGGEFVSLKFNDRSRFFGFAPTHNSKIPYESATLRLSRSEHLVWFEGLQYGRPNLRDMVGGPVYVSFNYPRDGLSDQQQQAHLQDAINLSGANWRGFNAKSLPVSVYYAQIIAKYAKEFETHGLPLVQVDTLTPWFL